MTSLASKVTERVCEGVEGRRSSQILISLTRLQFAYIFAALLGAEILAGVGGLIKEIGQYEDERSFKNVDKRHDNEENQLISMPRSYSLNEAKIFPFLRPLLKLLSVHLLY